MMAIVGFDFTKVSAEKNQKAKAGSINISNNISIKKVEVGDASVAAKGQKLLRYIFEFKSAYTPDLGSIMLEGEVLGLEDEKTAKDIEATFKKKKELPSGLMETVLSTALNKCNIQALILSQHVNLPPPIPLPKVQAAKKK